MPSPEVEVLRTIAERLSVQGPLSAQMNEMVATLSRGNESLASLLVMPEKLIQIKEVMDQILLILRERLPTPGQASDLGLKGGIVVDK